MVETKDVKGVEEKEVLYELMACICADNALEKKLKKWDLRNFHKGGVKNVK